MTTFTPTLIAELAKLDDAAVLSLLGEILEPSIADIFRMSEDFHEEAYPVCKAYRAAYAALRCVVDGDGDETDEDRRATEADWRRDDAGSYDFAPVTRISDEGIGA